MAPRTPRGGGAGVTATRPGWPWVSVKASPRMDNWWLVFWWTGPTGIGVFLALLGTFILLLAKADALNKRTKADVDASRR